MNVSRFNKSTNECKMAYKRMSQIGVFQMVLYTSCSEANEDLGGEQAEPWDPSPHPLIQQLLHCILHIEL